MKPRRINSLADLEATIEWHKQTKGLEVGYSFFRECVTSIPPVSTSALMSIYRTKNAKTIANWKIKYDELKET